MSSFVKSALTSVPASRSRGELEKVLLRYGCDGFGSGTDYRAQKITVWFRVPDDLDGDALTVPVKLEIDIRCVHDALYADKLDGSYHPSDLQQAERVAWRQLVLWVDAACSAASAGVQKMSDAFFAHTIITGPDGTQRRLTEHLDVLAGGNWRKQLAPPEDS
jgi:hypothetical protein